MGISLACTGVSPVHPCRTRTGDLPHCSHREPVRPSAGTLEAASRSLSSGRASVALRDFCGRAVFAVSAACG